MPELPLWEGGAQCGGGGKDDIQGFGVFIVILSDGQEGVPELPLWEGGAQCGGGGGSRILLRRQALRQVDKDIKKNERKGEREK